MGNYSYLSNINPTTLPRPPRPPPPLLKPGSNPLPAGSKCDIEGDWVGGVYLASGGQPFRPGLKVERAATGDKDGGTGIVYNFTQSQHHDGRVVGLGTVSYANDGVATITITSGPDAGAIGVADAWPGLYRRDGAAKRASGNSSTVGCSRILWNGGRTTWGKAPYINPTVFQVPVQMFGVASITTDSGNTVDIFTGDRYQTAPDGIFGHGFLYWEPIEYDALGTPQVLGWKDEITLS